MAPTRKAMTWLLAVFLATGTVFGQSLVETAKKEKERREASKKGTTTAVTNADLTRTKKKPAMVLVPDGAPPTGGEEAAPRDKPRPSAVAAPPTRKTITAQSTLAPAKTPPSMTRIASGWANPRITRRSPARWLFARKLDGVMNDTNPPGRVSLIPRSMKRWYVSIL